VQAEYVFAFGRAKPDVQGFGEAEIFGQPAYAEVREFRAEAAYVIHRPVVDDHDLMLGAESAKVLAKLVKAIERDDDDGDPRRLAFGCCGLILRGQADHFTVRWPTP
jgi:hypothetical protein